MTAGTVSDKTGYSLTQAFPVNFSSLAITGGGAVTAGTVSDKTGYSLTQSFPANFASLGINASGHVSRVTLVDTTTTNTDMITAAGIRSAVGLASANLDTQLTTIDDFLDTEVAAIKAKTDQLTFTTANRVDSTAITVSDKTGYSLSSAGIQAIWDALTSALTTVGSVGKFLVDRLDVVLSTRASQASLDTLDDYVDTEVAAIKAKTDNLPASFPTNFSSLAITVGGAVTAGTVSDKTGYSLSQAFPANFASLGINASGHVTRVVLVDTTTTNTDKVTAGEIRSAVGLAAANLDTQLTTIDDFLDTEIAAIKAKTDNLPAAPAAVGDIPTTSAITSAVFGQTINGSYDMLEAMRVIFAGLGGKTIVVGSSVKFRDPSDTKDVITATVVGQQRTAMTLDVT